MKKLIETDCIHFDPCQGRNKCCNDKVKSNRCIPNCGEFQGKESANKDYRSLDEMFEGLESQETMDEG